MNPNAVLDANEPPQNITSLSDDDEAIEDTVSNLNDEQRLSLATHGYCACDPLNNTEAALTVRGFVRLHATHDMSSDLIRLVIEFYHSRFDSSIFVKLICRNKEVPAGREYLAVARRNLSLVGLLGSGYHRFEIDKVSAQNMQKVCAFLNRHRGKAPAEIAKPIRSVKMERICEDPWDAQFINACTNKEVFQLIAGQLLGLSEFDGFGMRKDLDAH